MNNVTSTGGPSEPFHHDDNGGVDNGELRPDSSPSTSLSVPQQLHALAPRSDSSRRAFDGTFASALASDSGPAKWGRVEDLSMGDLTKIRRLDVEAFGAYQTVSVEDLKLIGAHGFFVGIPNQTGELVAYAAVINRPCDYCDIQYVAQLSPKQWYLEVFAVSPSLFGNGLGAKVLTNIMRTAQRNGVEEMRASLRPENHTSMHRLVNSNQFDVVGYHDNYFPGSDGDRLIVRRDFTQNKRHEIDVTAMRTTDLDDHMEQESTHTIGIPIGDDKDAQTRSLLRRALAQGFVGVAYLRQIVLDVPSILAFVHPQRMNSAQ